MSMSSWYNRRHTFGLKFIHMRWKLLPVALSTAQHAHLGDVLVPLEPALSSLALLTLLPTSVLALTLLNCVT